MEKYVNPYKQRVSKVGVEAERLFWVFLAGSILGCLAEMFFCIIIHRRFEMRTSLLLGLFNTVYGIGTVALYLGARAVGAARVGRRRMLRIFLLGCVMGTAVEFACSWFQERAFGTISWDYTGLMLNIDGRICLLFTVMWGVLAVAWDRYLQPRLDRFFASQLMIRARPAAVLIAIFLVLNIAVSLLAVSRWQMRLDGVPPADDMVRLIDKIFPNNFMEAIYANMRDALR